MRRNVSGLIVGAIETTSKFVAHSIDELLRRPEMIAGAREAAVTNDIEAVRRYAYEAVRFNPHAPLMLRYCATETALAVNTPRQRRLRAGGTCSGRHPLSHVRLGSIRLSQRVSHRSGSRIPAISVMVSIAVLVTTLTASKYPN